MKLTVIAQVCLSLLLVHIHFSLAKKRGGFGPKINLFKKIPKIDTKSKSKGGIPKQREQFNQGGNPQQPGRPGGYPNQGHYPNQGGYPQQPGRPGGYPNQGHYPNQGGYPQQRGGYPQQPGYPAGGYPAGGYPAQGYPYGGGYGSHGGGYGSYGGYPGGYMNYNPNNHVLSPHYGGSFGYGGYGAGRGSPFSHSVQSMGMYPSDKSRGFGRSAVMAAAGGAMAGMALGYGLGRFPRPPFHFHSPQEEHYYNHYMYRKYGVQSTDTNDYSRDYSYSKPPKTYESYMDSCMKRTDLLPSENRKSNEKPAATTTTTTTTTTAVVTSASGTGTGSNITETNSTAADNSSTTAPSNKRTAATTTTTITTTTTTTRAAPDPGTGSNSTKSNSTAAENSATTPPSTPRPLNESEANSVPPASQVVRKAATDDDDDTVSIVEIGYPALIKQMKVRRCVELYMVYTEKYLKKTTEPSTTDGVQGLEMGLQGLLAVVTSTTLMLLNSNMLMLLC